MYGKDPFPGINLPIFPDALQVHHVINNPEGTKSVQYKVKIKWPAHELITFYALKFDKMGLSKYSKDNYGRGEWEHYADGTLKDSSESNRYLESWVDKNHSIRILLAIDYTGTKSRSDGAEIFVACQISKFYDFTKLNEFYERLKKQNKEEEFNTMIGKYSNGNNVLDIKRALKENPDNEELREFAELIKQYK